MEERYHPVFGRLTDPEDIRVFDRQQEELAFDKAYQKAMEEEYQKQYEKEAELFDRCIRAINHLELEKDKWGAKELSEYAHCSIREADYVIKSMNL